MQHWEDHTARSRWRSGQAKTGLPPGNTPGRAAGLRPQAHEERVGLPIWVAGPPLAPTRVGNRFRT
eukprot:10228142-Lingulodinium_polyedra.AAC.1